MKRVFFYLMIAIMLSAGFQSMYGTSALSAESVEQWKAEFDSVCGQTDNAADMSVDELKKALKQCDLLQQKIEALEATPRKVYLKRLQMCRNLFTYLLEGKEKK
jgi:hypothetical protein